MITHDNYQLVVNTMRSEISTLFVTDILTIHKESSNDKYTSDDSVFDIMIKNNENLITALIGKAEGDGSTNLLKTVMDSLDKNAESIGAKLDAVKMGLSTFTKKLTAKFTAIKSWSAAIASHQHTALPAGKLDIVFKLNCLLNLYYNRFYLSLQIHFLY